MSLAIATNLANRKDAEASVLALMESLPGPVTYHIHDGKPAGTDIRAGEFPSAAKDVAKCSIICALEGTRGDREPIAGFVANESLRSAKLLHVIDDRPPSGDGTIPRRTLEILHVYIRYLFSEFQWLDRVTVPANFQISDGFFGLSESSDGDWCVTLKDINHRPRSSRSFRQ